jgi:hypothetical protein
VTSAGTSLVVSDTSRIAWLGNIINSCAAPRGPKVLVGRIGASGREKEHTFVIGVRCGHVMEHCVPRLIGCIQRT